MDVNLFINFYKIFFIIFIKVNNIMLAIHKH